MHFLDKRIQVICNELKKLSVVQSIPVEEFWYKKSNYVFPEDADKAEEPWERFDSKTMHWYGPDRHYWFRTQFKVPESFAGKSLWIHVKTQIDEWDDGKNPQFLLFVDGIETQGIDMNHRKVLITKETEKDRTYKLDLQSYTGTLHSEFNLIVEIQQIDPEIEGLYYDISVPLSAFPRMGKEDKARLAIEDILNNTINLLDLRTPYSEAFYKSIKEARAYIKKALYEDKAGFDDVIATCIGHTHIDVAWWWTVEQTREKIGRSFATVLKLMEEYPNYKFMSSQPQLYSFLKERYPRLYEKVKERVKEGRWEPEGGMWVEADCNLTSGESLVRQFMYGKRFFKEEFGVDNRILWLPDVFGYSGALPQIMKKCGIDYFMTTKLSWNQFNKIPYDTFMWRGIDGTEVLTHMITTLGVGQSTQNFFTTYNGMLHPDSIMGGWERYQNKDKGHKLIDERLKVLINGGEAVTIFNTLGFTRNDIVTLPELNAEGLKDADGAIYPIQKASGALIVYVKGLPSKGYKSFELVQKLPKEMNSPFILKDNTLETPFYKVTIDKNGHITSLYDKENDREIIKQGKAANLFRMYEDKPIYYDNWDIDIYYTEKYWDILDVTRMEWTELGSVRATLEIERSFSNSVLKQKIHFYADSRRIDFETYVDWKEHQHLLKVHFPVDIHTDEATFDIQFGNVTRKVHKNTSWDQARFECCGQKWMDLSEGHYGVSLLNDCKYGHSVDNSNMALTLIKSGIEPNPTTDQEEHFFTYALYPHKESLRYSDTIQEAAKLNQPALTVRGGKPGLQFSFASVDKKNVILETVKQAEDGDGIILRLYEAENAATKAKITLSADYTIDEVSECNLIEEFIKNIPSDKNSFEIAIRPYEIKTYRLKLK